MREHKMTLNLTPLAAIQNSLHNAARSQLAAWQQKTNVADADIVGVCLKGSLSASAAR